MYTIWVINPVTMAKRKPLFTGLPKEIPAVMEMLTGEKEWPIERLMVVDSFTGNVVRVES